MPKKFTYPEKDETLDSGAIIHWSRQAKGWVPITCWKCGEDFLRVASLAQRPGFRGAHRECHHNRGRDHLRARPREVIPEFGSIIDWPRMNGATVPVKCGSCKAWREVLTTTLTDKRRKKGYSGLCVACYEDYRTGRPLRTEPWVHPTGTKVFPGDRDPDDAQKVRIICHGCKQSKFTGHHNPRKEDWTGLCTDCLAARPSPKKVLADKVLANGTIIEFSKEKLGQVPVLYSKCQCTHWMKRANAITNGGKCGAVCNYHRNNSSALVERIVELTSHASESVEKRRGPEVGTENFDRHLFLSDLNHAINDLSAKGKKAREINRKLVTKNYRLGGEFLSPDGLTKRLRLSGVEIDFRDYVQSRVEVKS